ncbi:TetR/AcrR family transcriptional regulator [Ningiella sp. W23]|uniref:TetR/AcrR family transcriptional regulator n=1 Tax=Ningiella sp. W23 TaxID=3023715 RepID=UPI003757145D
MPQQVKYDLERVLEMALPLAIERGYRACSMHSLIKDTGFNRRAFYIHFKNKEDFFEALLNHYLQNHLLPLNQYLHISADAQESIQAYFNQYQQLIASKGCLLSKLIVEMGRSNHAMQHQARWFYDQLQLEFIALIERAQNSGALGTNINAEQQALKLTCLAQGFAISSHIIQGQEDIALMIASVFSLSS